VTSVLAFCDYFEDPMGGGAERVSAEVYRRLVAEHGATVDVVTGVTPGGTPADVGGVTVRRCRGLDLSKLLGAQLSVAPGVAASGWRAMRRHPDIVHASSIHFFGSIVGVTLARIHRIPVVTTCHLSGLDALPAGTRRWARLYERCFGRYVLRHSDRVIAVSNAVRDHVVSLGTDPTRVDVVENGVDLDRFRPDPARGRAATRNEGKPVTIAFVGRLIANKEPLAVIRAVRTFEPGRVRLLMVGVGPLEGEVRAAAQGCDDIEILGARTDVDRILARSDVFVRPSSTEGRSLAVLEAMASGCAVIASDIPANAELVDDGHTGLLVPVRDDAALASALHRLVDEPDVRRKLGEGARAAVSDAGWERTAKETNDVFASVIP
jgi:glycosyltransferase involved in cell wall biosynthesis